MNNPPAPASAPADDQLTRVLVIYPNANKSQVIADVLEIATPGVGPILAFPVSGPGEAWLRLAAAPIDIVVLGLPAPAADPATFPGDYGFLAELKRRSPATEAIVIGDFSESRAVRVAMAAGAHGCFDPRASWGVLRHQVGRLAETLQDRKTVQFHERRGHLLTAASTVVHNFNAVAAILAGLVDVAQLKGQTTLDADGLREVKHAAARLHLMIKNLLATTRGQEPIVVRAEVEFARFWADAEPGFRALCAAAGIGFRSEIAFTGSVRIGAELMRQALEQLCYNAREAVWLRHRGSLTSSGQITIRATHTATGGLALTVIDNGVGMTPELTARILQDLRPGDIRGSGLGLMFVKEIVAQHEGTLSVMSEKGRGSEFTITLP